MGALSRIF